MSPIALGLVRAAGILCFFVGVFVLAQAYTMALHGMWLDCFAASGCALVAYGEPTLPSALYGSVLAVAATATFYTGVKALRWLPKR